MEKSVVTGLMCILVALAAYAYYGLSGSTPSFDLGPANEIASQTRERSSFYNLKSASRPTPTASTPEEMAALTFFHGTVLDESQEVIPGVMIELQFGSDEYSIQSDQEGYFEIPYKSLGTYKLSVSKDGYADTHHEIVVDDRYQNLPITIVLLQQGWLRGVVQCNDPEQAISVGLKPRSSESRKRVVGGDVRLINQCEYNVETRAGQPFEIAGVRPGSYMLICGYADVSLTQSDIIIVSDQYTDVALDLALGGRIFGQVSDSENANLGGQNVVLKRFVRKRDEKGFLIGEQDGTVAMTVIDPNGRYALEDVPAGSYLLRLDSEADENSLSYICSRVIDLSVGEELRKDLQEQNVAGAMLQGQCTLDGNASFTTIVLTKNQEPCVSRSEMVDQHGMFHVTGLDDGEYHVLFINPVAVFKGDLKVAQSSVRVGADAAYLSEHYASSSLSGIFLPDPAGSIEDYRGARVELELVLDRDIPFANITRTTLPLDKNGAFTVDAVVSGTYKVSIVAQGEVVVQRTEAIASDTHLTLRAADVNGA